MYGSPNRCPGCRLAGEGCKCPLWAKVWLLFLASWKKKLICTNPAPSCWAHLRPWQPRGREVGGSNMLDGQYKILGPSDDHNTRYSSSLILKVLYMINLNSTVDSVLTDVKLMVLLEWFYLDWCKTYKPGSWMDERWSHLSSVDVGYAKISCIGKSNSMNIESLQCV